MKLLREEGMFLTNQQIRKVMVATTIITLTLYAVAMICSLCGLDIFILQYENTWLDKVELTLRSVNLIATIQDIFITLETCIVLTFVMQKLPKWYYVLAIYGIPLGIAYALGYMPFFLETLC